MGTLRIDVYEDNEKQISLHGRSTDLKKLLDIMNQKMG